MTRWLGSTALVLFALVLVPQEAAAASTTWELRNQKKLEGWNTGNLTSVQLKDEGFVISTQTQGQIVRVSDFNHAIDTISITYISPTGGAGIFFWRPPELEGSSVYQIPVTFDASSAPQKLVLDMSQITEWTERSNRVGFVVNAGTSITLQQLTFSGPGIIDSIVWPVKTFFQFDVARPYSINFLWGPMMTLSPEQYAALFTQMPPRGSSWNSVFYIVLLVAAVAAWLLKGKTKHATMIFVLTLAVLWGVYDLRMGIEQISYATADWNQWWSKPVQARELRDRGAFTQFMEMMPQYTEGKDKYVFIASHGWPFWGSMKYKTYPALPVNLDGDTEGIETWIIYNRPDISPNEEGRLVVDGEVVSPPGDIIFPFDTGSFVFLTRP